MPVERLRIFWVSSSTADVLTWDRCSKTLCLPANCSCRHAEEIHRQEPHRCVHHQVGTLFERISSLFEQKLKKSCLRGCALLLA